MERTEIKAQARQLLKENPVKMPLAYALTLIIPGIIVGLLAYSTLQEFRDLSGDFAGMVAAVERIQDRLFSGSAMLSLLSMVLTAPLTTGLYHLYHQLFRGEPAGIALVFSHFKSLKKIGRAIGVTVMVYLYTLAWGALAGIGGALVIWVIMAVFNQTLFAGIVVLAAVIALIGLILWLTLRYQPAFFIVAANDDYTVMEAIRESRDCCQLYNAKLFRLYLSFLPLLILSGIVAAIGGAVSAGLTAMLTALFSIFLQPYVTTSMIIFFDYIAPGRLGNRFYSAGGGDAPHEASGAFAPLEPLDR